MGTRPNLEEEASGMKEYYEEDSWRCPDCGTHEVEADIDGDLWVVSCAGCGITISDSYIGEDRGEDL